MDPTPSAFAERGPTFSQSQNRHRSGRARRMDSHSLLFDLNARRDGYLRLRSTRATHNLSQCVSLCPASPYSVTLEDGTAYLMLLNPTGGVLGGDYLSRIVRKKTHVCLTTPSQLESTALRKNQRAGTVIHVGEGSTLEYLPDHVSRTPARLSPALRVRWTRSARSSDPLRRPLSRRSWNFRRSILEQKSSRPASRHFSSHIHQSCAQQRTSWLMSNSATRPVWVYLRCFEMLRR